ncbi:Maternal embryonic leucine zipper kinase [Schistosoma japonicum]|nr:Maternal embryonic leucine zipper kinase [Schistosoma japonicum]
MAFTAPKALQRLYLFSRTSCRRIIWIIVRTSRSCTLENEIKILDKRKLGSDAYRVTGETEDLKQLNHVKINDLGVCAKGHNLSMFNTFCGFFAYVAPGVSANKEYSGRAVDIWFLGVMLFASLCGRLPLDLTKPEKLLQTIGKVSFLIPDGLSKTSKQLLSQMIC